MDTNSPTEFINTSKAPLNTEGKIRGTIIFLKVMNSDAPRVPEASSSEGSMALNPAIEDCVSTGRFLIAYASGRIQNVPTIEMNAVNKTGVLKLRISESAMTVPGIP